MAYKGISTKIMKDGTKNIFVRFQYDGKIFPIKNFTIIFGCNTEKSAKTKLDEVKLLLSQGKDPFSKTYSSIEELYKQRRDEQVKNLTWVKTTARTYDYFYENHIKKIIGWKRIEKVNYEDIKKIQKKFKAHQGGSINKLIDILRPIFKEEMKKGNLTENIMLKVEKVATQVQREKLSNRTPMKNIDIIRKIYNSIEKYNKCQTKNIFEHRMFFYMIIMTAHRVGEVIQLEKKHCNLKENKIISPTTITKTREEYHFPIPDECIEYIRNHDGEGFLWHIPKGGQSVRVWQRILDLAQIEVYPGHQISIHDTRRMMLSIMINDLKIDSKLADACLEHKTQGVIKYYLEFTYEEKVEAYKKYWSYIKEEEYIEPTPHIYTSKEKTLEKPENNDTNIEKLEKLIDMFEKDYLTKEEFIKAKAKILD